MFSNAAPLCTHCVWQLCKEWKRALERSSNAAHVLPLTHLLIRWTWTCGRWRDVSCQEAAVTENSPGPQTVRRAVNGGFLSREARRLSSPPLADTAFYQKQLAPHWAAQSMFPSAVGKQLTTTSCYTHTTPGSTAADGRPRPRDHPTTSLQEPGKAFTLGLLFYITPPPPVQQSASHYCLLFIIFIV